MVKSITDRTAHGAIHLNSVFRRRAESLCSIADLDTRRFGQDRVVWAYGLLATVLFQRIYISHADHYVIFDPR